jgi:hypothetical protein
MEVTRTVAHYDKTKFIALKSFIVQVSGANFVKLFAAGWLG